MCAYVEEMVLLLTQGKSKIDVHIFVVDEFKPDGYSLENANLCLGRDIKKVEFFMQ